MLRRQTASWWIRVTVLLFLVVTIGGAGPERVRAVNDYNDGGSRFESPLGTIDYWFDSQHLPPSPSSEFTTDVSWALEQWDNYGEGWNLNVAPGSANNHNLRIAFEELSGDALGKIVYYVNPNRCGDVSPECVLKFDTDPDGSPVWETGGASVQSNEIDFRTVALHEAGHLAGLGHSTASRRYNGVSITPTSLVVMSAATTGSSSVRHQLSKDDCASGNLQYFGDAVCNRTITQRWGSEPRYGIDSTSSTPRYFHGWGFNSAWQYLSCNSSGVGVTPNSCHWRFRPYPGTSSGDFGVIYDAEGAGDGGWSTEQGMQQGTEWRMRVNVGAPNYNTGNVTFKMCLYMRDDAYSNPARWKSQQVCTSWLSLAPGSVWTWRQSPSYYELPADADDDKYIRSYITMQENGNTLFVNQWEVERRAYP